MFVLDKERRQRGVERDGKSGFLLERELFCMHAAEPIRCIYLSVFCLTGVFTPVLLSCKCQSAIWGISSSAGSL